MGLGQLFEVGSVALLESREAFRTAECFVHSITQNKEIGRPLLDEVFHVLGVALQPQAVPHFITSPGKAANLQALVGHGNLHAGFHFPMFKQTLDHGVTIEEEGGTFLDLGEEVSVEAKNRNLPQNYSKQAKWDFRTGHIESVARLFVTDKP